jgi:hypothetical protein
VLLIKYQFQLCLVFFEYVNISCGCTFFWFDFSFLTDHQMGRARHYFSRIAKKQSHLQNHQSQNHDVSTLRNKKKFKGQNKNKIHKQNTRPFVRNRKRSADTLNWGSPIPEKIRVLSPIRDENGTTLSKEQQEVFYRNKVNDFELKIPTLSNADTLPTKNILAIVSGLTEEEPTTSGETYNNVNGSNKVGYDIPLSNRTFPRRISPKLPQIPLEDFEGDAISDDDVICLPNIKRNKRNRRSSNKLRKPIPKPKPKSLPKIVDLIELSSDEEDDDSVICLDDSEKEFANLSITTERIQKTVETSKKIVKDHNSVPGQVITVSQHISETTTTVKTSVTQSSLLQHMGIDRYVRHYRRSFQPLASLPLELHLDSLSFHIALHKKITLRGPEFVVCFLKTNS